MNVYLTMETSLSFGYCSVASNLGQYKEIEETFQLYRGGGSQSVLILEKQSATAYPRKCSATRPAGCEAHLTCGNCPMHCATVAYPKKSSIFDIFWDQINGKNCSVQQHVCQPEGLYSLGNFNVYMYVLTLESYSSKFCSFTTYMFYSTFQSIFAYLLFYILLGIFFAHIETSPLMVKSCKVLAICAWCLGPLSREGFLLCHTCCFCCLIHRTGPLYNKQGHCNINVLR